MALAFLAIRAVLAVPAPVLGLMTRWGSSEASALPRGPGERLRPGPSAGTRLAPVALAFLAIRAVLAVPAPVLGLMTRWGSSEASALPRGPGERLRPGPSAGTRLAPVALAFLAIRAVLAVPAPVLALMTGRGRAEAPGPRQALVSSSAPGLLSAPGLRPWPWRSWRSAPSWRSRPRCWA